MDGGFSGGIMFLTAGTKKIIYLIAFLFLFSQAAFADDQNAVSFSGKVKKVIVKKNKVAVKDPVTKKTLHADCQRTDKNNGLGGSPGYQKRRLHQRQVYCDGQGVVRRQGTVREVRSMKPRWISAQLKVFSAGPFPLEAGEGSE